MTARLSRAHFKSAWSAVESMRGMRIVEREGNSGFLR